jgi:hypothetical protein
MTFGALGNKRNAQALGQSSAIVDPIITNAFPSTIAAGLFTYTPIVLYANGVVTFAISSGALGLGLTLDTTTGVISGTALIGVLAGVVLTVTDSLGRTYSINIDTTIS